MQTVTTQQGKAIAIISQADLREPRTIGTYVRAYCHIHGSDHQRSLSINRTTGWGHCFNATCQVTVLVAEWNSSVAANLTRFSYTGETYHSAPAYSLARKKLPAARQLVLLPPPRETPAWQQDELSLLQSLHEHGLLSLRQHPRGQAYIQARGMPLESALAANVGYLSTDVLRQCSMHEQHLLRRWTDRIIFPLLSPDGQGYIGRCVAGWRPGMDENRHKRLLDQQEKARRWIKTNPAGWFCSELDHLSTRIVVVEGGFDRLTLLQAGFRTGDVVALAGTAADNAWLPPHVRSVVLALDGDQGGYEATHKLTEQFRLAGRTVSVCSPTQDQAGKDWNERWRTLGRDSVQPLIETFQSLRQTLHSA